MFKNIFLVLMLFIFSPQACFSGYPVRALNSFRLSYEIATLDGKRFLETNSVAMVVTFKKNGVEMSRNIIPIPPLENAPLNVRIPLDTFQDPCLPQYFQSIDEGIKFLNENWRMDIGILAGNIDSYRVILKDVALFRSEKSCKTPLAFRIVFAHFQNIKAYKRLTDCMLSDGGKIYKYDTEYQDAALYNLAPLGTFANDSDLLKRVQKYAVGGSMNVIEVYLTEAIRIYDKKILEHTEIKQLIDFFEINDVVFGNGDYCFIQDVFNRALQGETKGLQPSGAAPAYMVED